MQSNSIPDSEQRAALIDAARHKEALLYREQQSKLTDLIGSLIKDAIENNKNYAEFAVTRDMSAVVVDRMIKELRGKDYKVMKQSTGYMIQW